MKICKCGYETKKTSFKFCPLCGKQLTVLVLEEDGTYKAEREACRVCNPFLDQEAIYYYKISPIDNTLAWIYASPDSEHWILGCCISKVKPIAVERIERCALRNEGKCGNAKSCEICLPKIEQKYPWINFCQ